MIIEDPSLQYYYHRGPLRTKMLLMPMPCQSLLLLGLVSLKYKQTSDHWCLAAVIVR